MINKIVVHYLDGTIQRGYTTDFQAQKEVFHLVVKKDKQENSILVNTDNVKAVFFVKALRGMNQNGHEAQMTFEDEEFKDKNLVGKKVKIEFIDGEVLYGLTLGYSAQRKGFFFTPIDQETNNERIFAVLHAVKDITFYD